MNGLADRHPGRVLIVEDEPKIAGLLADYFAQAGFATDLVEDGRAAVERIRDAAPELVLLDVMLPGLDGLGVCREVRAFSEVPIMMITARVEEIDRLLGLELGADDYICKPFSPREVVARARAILRRAQVVVREDSIRYRDLAIDIAKFEVMLAGATVEVTPVEFRLLKTLASQPGRVFSRGQLMSAAYDDRRVVSDRTMDSHIKNLRRKLTAAAPAPDAATIASVYGVGYKLE